MTNLLFSPNSERLTDIRNVFPGCSDHDMTSHWKVVSATKLIIFNIYLPIERTSVNDILGYILYMYIRYPNGLLV